MRRDLDGSYPLIQSARGIWQGWLGDHRLIQTLIQYCVPVAAGWCRDGHGIGSPGLPFERVVW